MRGPQDEHEAGVNDDLTQVVGTRDKVKQRSMWNRVSVGALDLQVSKYFMSHELQIPSGQEHKSEDPAVEGQGEGGKAGDGGTGEPRGLADIACGGAEVVSVANNVVSNVHG